MLNVTQQAFLNHIHGTHEFVSVAALLSTDKESKIRMLFTCSANQLIFFERQGEWFLYKNMLASFECFNGNLDVPVIGGDDADSIDVFSFKNFPVVSIRIGFTGTNFGVILGTQRMSLVNVTNCNNVSKVGMATGVSRAHAAYTNTTNVGPIILVLIGESFFGPIEVGR